MFDKIYSRTFGDKVIQYGVFEGSDTVFFIKVGQDGSIYGYADKYMHLAKRVHDKFGFTCITSSNPYDGRDPLGNAFELMDEILGEYEVYYMGHSNGARAGALFGYKYPRIKAMVLSDAPLYDLDVKDINEGILRFEGRAVTVYGTEDESYPYIHLLDDRIENVIIEGEDHNYTKDMEDLYGLPFKYLL